MMLPPDPDMSCFPAAFSSSVNSLRDSRGILLPVLRKILRQGIMKIRWKDLSFYRLELSGNREVFTCLKRYIEE